MYTAFYGLREKPFALSPDPRFLYLAGSHREALAHLLYGIEQGEGFISVTGEVGTGKTTLCRTLLERLEGDLELAFLFNPSRSALELLQSICAEFDLPAEGLTRRSLMAQLNTFLVEQKRIGRRVLLIIDEAQTLSENTLEQVRLLSNLETSREKLIQILLLGQPELDRKLDERGLRQLRQRISVRWQLEPLSPPETRAYVRHRLAVAAGEPKDLFSEAALREVHRRTGGVPRLVNQLCDRALLAGYAARAAQIGPRLVRAAADEIPDAQRPRDRYGPARKGGFFTRPWFVAAASLGLVGASLFAGLQVGRHGLTDSLRASVLKPEALRNDGVGRLASHAAARSTEARAGMSPPEVGANAPPPDLVEVPPLIELIGYVPDEVREELNLSARLPAGVVSSPAPGSGVIASDTTLEIPTRLGAQETALAEGLLSQLLANRSERRALSESQAALFERFGRLVPRSAAGPRNSDDLLRSFEARGLEATPFEGGSIDLLRRLDHPVVLPLAAMPGTSWRASANDPRWVAITGFNLDRARVAGLVPDQVVTITTDELAAHWLEKGIIVWERFEPVPSMLALDSEGEGVLWLQRSLAELGFFEGPSSGRFDPATRAAVGRFQTDRGLVSDGVAGPLTQIALYAGIARYPVPRLSQAPAATGARAAAAATPQAKPHAEGVAPPAPTGDRG